MLRHSDFRDRQSIFILDATDPCTWKERHLELVGVAVPRVADQRELEAVDLDDILLGLRYPRTQPDAQYPECNPLHAHLPIKMYK